MKSFPRLTSRGRCLAAASAFLLVCGVLSGFADLIRAGIFAAVLLICAVITVLCRNLNLAATRETPAGYRLRSDEETTVHLHISSRRRARLPLELVDDHTFLPAKKPRWALSGLARGTTHLEYTVYAQLRGEYQAGPGTAWLSEPLGLAQRRITFGPANRWLVWPRLVDLDGGSPYLPGTGEEEMTAKHASASGYSGASLREYAPGDDIRHVHWAATARHGDLMVRQFDPPARPQLRLVLAGNVAEAGVDSDWETLVSLAASAVDYLQQREVPTELVLESEHFTSREASLDALAAVGRCSSPNPPEWRAPTVLFQHPSAQPELLAPLDTTSVALVLGEARGNTIGDLTDLGWEAICAQSAEEAHRCLTAILREHEGRR